jgi:hypothetical protein
MSEISSRPWSIVKGEYRGDYTPTIEIHDSKNEAILGFMTDEKDLAEHIVKCVNEHDVLVAEVARLKQDAVKLKRLLARAYMFADWTNVEVENILDAFEQELKDGDKG